MAVVRGVLVVAPLGADQCTAVEIAMEQGSDLDDARCIQGCPREPVAAWNGGGICRSHLDQLEQEGGWLLE
jgi:hypothetical protein